MNKTKMAMWLVTLLLMGSWACKSNQFTIDFPDFKEEQGVNNAMIRVNSLQKETGSGYPYMLTGVAENYGSGDSGYCRITCKLKNSAGVIFAIQDMYFAGYSLKAKEKTRISYSSFSSSELDNAKSIVWEAKWDGQGENAQKTNSGEIIF